MFENDKRMKSSTQKKKHNNNRIQLKELFKTLARSESDFTFKTRPQFINKKHFKHHVVEFAFTLL